MSSVESKPPRFQQERYKNCEWEREKTIGNGERNEKRIQKPKKDFNGNWKKKKRMHSKVNLPFTLISPSSGKDFLQLQADKGVLTANTIHVTFRHVLDLLCRQEREREKTHHLHTSCRTSSRDYGGGLYTLLMIHHWNMLSSLHTLNFIETYFFLLCSLSENQIFTALAHKKLSISQPAAVARSEKKGE